MEATCSKVGLNTVRFSSASIGNKQIRFIYLGRPGSFYVAAKAKEEDVPLFLGADVLNGSSILVKNHGRVHARFAKDNLATKVSIKGKGASVEGINHSSQLWFYNVQGLFRVAFEYLSQDAQRDCLLHLKDTWLQTLHHSELPTSMCLTYCVGALGELQEGLQASRQTILSDSKDPHQVAKCVGDTLELMASSGQEVELIGNGGIMAQTGVSPTVAQTITGQTVNIEGYGEVVLLDDLNVSGISDVEVSVCSQADDTKHTYEPQLQGSLTTDDLSRDMLSFVQEQEQKFPEGERTNLRKLVVLLQLFRIEFVEKNPDTKGFPFELLEQYVQLISDKSAQKEFYNSFDIPLYLNIVLCIICEWLGKELNTFSEIISKRVETFKLKHIDVINHLPSPQSLVNALFPACMKILLVNWIGQHGIGCADRVSSSDHDYSPPSKRQAVDTTATDTGSSFPFVQLILEFTNNVLISGVAHVVYTRLLHDGSC